MKYYQISTSAEPKIIGVKNGVYQVEIIDEAIEKNQAYMSFDHHFSGYNKEFWENQDIIYTLNPPIIKGKMLKTAKITDIMGYGPNYHFLYKIYSEKYINMINSFSAPKNKTFEFEIEHVAEKYYLLFIDTINLKDINYEKSTVVTGFKQLNNIKYHSVCDREQYIEFNYNNPLGRFEKIAIKKEYSLQDIISIEATSLPFYSERLIDFLLDSGITGLQVAYENSIQLEFV